MGTREYRAIGAGGHSPDRRSGSTVTIGWHVFVPDNVAGFKVKTGIFQRRGDLEFWLKSGERFRFSDVSDATIDALVGRRG